VLLGLGAALHLGGAYRAPTLRAQLGLWLGAGLCWLLALLALGRAAPLRPGTPAGRRAILGLGLLALLMRLPLLPLPVVHSDDVYRYLWDGAVQQAGHNPYAGPPDAREYAPVQAVHGALHARINHRDLPTIYPPAAEQLFRLPFWGSAGPLDRATAVRRWKGVVTIADLLILALLMKWLRDAGRDPRWAAVWGAAPLPAVELAWNGHLESLGILPLLAALWLWQRRGGREWAVGALAALALLVKPVAAAALPAALQLPPRRQLALGAGALVLGAALVLPYGPRGALPPSLGEYGRRWRSNDGAYAVVQAVTDAAVGALYRPPYHTPWSSPRLARALTGRDRDTVWPDELSAALARGVVLLGLLGLAALAVRRRWPPVQTALSLLLAYELLTPALHPWYELWPLALAALQPRLLPPVAVLAALAPLAYLPLPDYLAGRGFHEAVFSRAVQHLGGWAALLASLAARRPSAGSKSGQGAAGAD
jgi:hypothetical protein